MIETCLLAVLSALGIVLIVWCIAGFRMLPTEGDGYCVLFSDSSEACLSQLRSYRFLLSSGLIRLPLYIVDVGFRDEDRLYWAFQAENHGDIRLFSLKQWVDFIETERLKRVSRT